MNMHSDLPSPQIRFSYLIKKKKKHSQEIEMREREKMNLI